MSTDVLAGKPLGCFEPHDLKGTGRRRTGCGGAGIRERESSFPVLIDGNSDLAQLLEFLVVPLGGFLDADGVVRCKHLGDFDISDPRVSPVVDRDWQSLQLLKEGDDKSLP